MEILEVAVQSACASERDKEADCGFRFTYTEQLFSGEAHTYIDAVS